MITRTPSPKSHICLPACLPDPEAVPQDWLKVGLLDYVLSESPGKTGTQSSHVVHFYFSQHFDVWSVGLNFLLGKCSNPQSCKNGSINASRSPTWSSGSQSGVVLPFRGQV